MRKVVVGRRSQPAAIERVYTVKKTKKGKKIVAKDHLLDDEIDTPTWAKKRERPNDSLEDWVAGPDVEPGEATTKKQRRGKVCGYFLSVERAFDVLQTQNDFLREWKEEACTLHLMELMDLEAPPVDGSCMECRDPSAAYRCLDCIYGQQLLCASCCLTQHHHQPFHRIQRWTGHFFDRDDLGNLGVVIHLGHGGQPCPNDPASINFEKGTEVPDDWQPYEDDVEEEEGDDDEPLLGIDASSLSCHTGIVIVDSSGIWKRQVKRCLCPNAPAAHIQLLRMRLFPASIKRPSTAFTFSVLDQFHIEALECKTAAGNFYSKLRRMTNSAFPSSVPVSDHIIFVASEG